MKIYKRNGVLVPFKKDKIENAILSAFYDVDGRISNYARVKAQNIANFVEEQAKEHKREWFKNKDNPDYHEKAYLSVEDIQDLVEKGLMSTKRKDVAKEYVIYRNEHSNKRILKHKIEGKLFAKNIENQNANVDENSFGGRQGEAMSEFFKDYALNNLISEKSRFLHESNIIYIHDLSSYAVGMHNCLTVPLDKLLANGFNTRQTDVRPANSINTAFQLVAVLFQLQSLQQFGGVSASHLDWSMVPYVRKSFKKHFHDGLVYMYKPDEYIWNEDDDELLPIDSHEYKYFARAYKYAMDMTIKETEQAVEGMYHNLNTLQSRSGNQLPFTSINYGTCTLPEGRMVIKALLHGSLKGVGRLHRTPIFPCGIFQLMNGVNRAPGDPNYDLYKLALKSTAKRLYPNYANVDWSGNEGYDRNDPKTYFSTMGLVAQLSSCKIF